MILNNLHISDYELQEYDILSYDDYDTYQYNEFGDAIGNRKYLWDLDKTTGTVLIPYVIDSRSTPELREKIAAAISEFHQKTCIR